MYSVNYLGIYFELIHVRGLKILNGLQIIFLMVLSKQEVKPCPRKRNCFIGLFPFLASTMLLIIVYILLNFLNS